jgi:hypothetical protein
MPEFLTTVVSICLLCKREYVWVPPDGGTCLWCQVPLKAVETQTAKTPIDEDPSTGC